MATLNLTTKTVLDVAIPEKWDAKVRLDAARKAFWDRFEGREGSEAPIITRNDFVKEPGDLVHIQTISQLGGTGVTGESTLQGNEEKLSLGQFDITIDWVRHAVALTKKAKKEANFQSIMMANELLSTWLARYKDADMFSQLLDSDSPDTLYAGDATTDASLGTNDRFGTTELDRIRLALMRKGAIPMRVIRSGKHESHIYGVVISEIDEYNLIADSTWVDAQKNAGLRGSENPLFTMALGLYHGMLVFTHRGLSGDQGTPIRPEAALSGSHTAGVATLTVGPNALKDYTKFFPTTGTVSVTGTDGTREYVSYTGKTANTLTGCTRGATYGSENTSGAAYSGGELVTLFNHRSRIIGFGAEIAARSYAKYPTTITQMYDYEFEHGVGIECVYGQKAMLNTNDTPQNYVVMDCYAGNPSNTI